MTNWASATFSAAVKSTRFREKNGATPFNASGVVRVARRRFVFVDNNDPSALFEFELDSGGERVEWIRRRPLAGLTEGQLRDPEGLCRVDNDGDGEVTLVAASSFCVAAAGRSGRRQVSEGLVRIRYQSAGDLRAEAMDGFRAWLLEREPTLAYSAEKLPDDGGLNVEGLAWDPRTNALLFGLRGPAEPGRIAIVKVPIEARVAPWATSSLGATSTMRVDIPQSTATRGVRDIAFDERAGGFLILLGRSTSRTDEPFQLCTWDGEGNEAGLLDVRFHRSMKPEGIAPFSSGDKRKLVIVDDDGGYAVVRLSRSRSWTRRVPDGPSPYRQG